jgi:HAD superfamily hydrolase (TIGR01549 family)
LFKPTAEVKNILWDFDGVLMNSMPVRDKGFYLVLSNHPEEEVEALMKFHRQNGGLSRYVKFRYFFEEIKGQKISEEEVLSYARKFSEVMLRELVNRELLIYDAMDFVQNYHKKYNMHVVSGSDQEELRHICSAIGIDHYFKSIHGSPTPKKQLVHDLLDNNSYFPSETILIGDSVNDLQAALVNGLTFFGYNNDQLLNHCKNFIETFSDEKQ